MIKEGGIVVRESTGALETPWGSQLRDIESRIREADEIAVLARWESGRHILKRREGKQLPHGLIGEIENRLGVSKREIRYRMKFAEVCDTEDEVCKALQTYGSWWAIIKNVLTQRSESTSESVDGHVYIHNTYESLRKLYADDLSDSDLEALRGIMEEIERIFAEVK